MVLDPAGNITVVAVSLCLRAQVTAAHAAAAVLAEAVDLNVFVELKNCCWV
jgi:hypothetical protein